MTNRNSSKHYRNQATILRNQASNKRWGMLRATNADVAKECREDSEMALDAAYWVDWLAGEREFNPAWDENAPAEDCACGLVVAGCILCKVKVQA